MGSVFYMLFTRCAWPLTATAPMATRLHLEDGTGYFGSVVGFLQHKPDI